MFTIVFKAIRYENVCEREREREREREKKKLNESILFIGIVL
jgi:hypothetical protein